MEDKSEKLVETFKQSIFLYQELAEKVHQLLIFLIKEKIAPHQISFRIKEVDSLLKKIIRKNYKYSSLNEITDLIGIRIVTYFEDDIDIIEKIISSEFTIDKENSTDRRNIEVDKFGYRSGHFVASLNNDRLKLTEYKKYKDLKFEIQIRSILQHSWAEIEHDIGYKGESEIPHTAKRTFYRVAALLEQADIEFSKLRKEIKDYENIVATELTNDNLDITINKSSLIAFIKSSEVLNVLEKKAETHLDCICDDDIDDDILASNELIKAFKRLGLNKIKDIENALIEYEDAIIKDQEKFIKSMTNFKSKKGTPENLNKMKFVKGAPLLWLRNILQDIEKRNS